MTVLTVNINDKKDAKALKAIKAVIEAFELDYAVEDEFITKDQQQEILRREKEYKLGSMKLYSVDEVKASLNYKD